MYISGNLLFDARNQLAAFWASVAAAFKDDPSAMFDLFSEPYARGSYALSWACWRDGGCQMSNVSEQQSLNGSTYTVTGMAALVAAVCGAGILLAGLDYANDFSQWLAYKPNDSQWGASCATTRT